MAAVALLEIDVIDGLFVFEVEEVDVLVSSRLDPLPDVAGQHA